MKKVLLLGSGGLQVGQAGEFDYSGSQAIKALKEEGISVILINPNIATIQTEPGLASRIYFLPLTPYFVTKIIEKEKPQGILLSFGGQTALNCGIELHRNGTLKKHKVAVLGTPVSAIEETEDRDLFVKKLAQIGVKTPTSQAVTSLPDALVAARKIGYPIMVRAAFALGGLGSGIARDQKGLRALVENALSVSPQVLIEECLFGWKEVEYEVVRDSKDNCITVCNMENFDPLGIHTGESIVVAPSQTLDNTQYHFLREIAIKTIRHIGIVGECNIQYALDPKSNEYRVIEVNARLSRSSALASKATGYPLAYVAAKLSLGHTLPELRNAVTKVTAACFEPALDYVVVKMPRWDLKKLRNANAHIGSAMKSVGEVMAIGRTFEEALQKGCRMLDIGMLGVVGNTVPKSRLAKELSQPTDLRLFYLTLALKTKMPISQAYKLTGIDPWFLYKIQNLLATEKELRGKLTPELLRKAKQQGFSDAQIGKIKGKGWRDIMALRHKHGIRPVVRQIDTLAAEYPAKTNYLYLTYNGTHDDVTFPRGKKALVIGSGVYRIGSSVEFDWCCVSAVRALAKQGYTTIMANYNPETVSTDYDTCDRLYFDELNFETVYEIYAKEKPKGLVLSTGGQIPNGLAMKCAEYKLPVLGTQPASIDSAEDRYKFSKLLDSLKIDQPQWKELQTLAQALKFAKEVGYPVLVRPSYVLSGAAMNVAFDAQSLTEYLKEAAEVSSEHPVVITKFIQGAKELEIDAVAQRGELVTYAVTEHVENAGVHSGDATIVMPAQKIYLETHRRIVQIAREIAKALSITGPFNIQFLAKRNAIKVIECNLRASRSFPFISKVAKVNLIDLSIQALGPSKLPERTIDDLSYVGVKTAQFSFARFKGADPLLRVEMSSTGEVATLGRTLHETLLTSMISAGFSLPKKDILFSVSGDPKRYAMLDTARQLTRHGYHLWATANTAAFLSSKGVPVRKVYKISQGKEPNAHSLIVGKKVDLVINIPKDHSAKQEDDDLMLLRRLAVDFGVPLLTNTELAKLFVDALVRVDIDKIPIKGWDEYA